MESQSTLRGTKIQPKDENYNMANANPTTPATQAHTLAAKDCNPEAALVPGVVVVPTPAFPVELGAEPVPLVKDDEELGVPFESSGSRIVAWPLVYVRRYLNSKYALSYLRAVPKPTTLSLYCNIGCH